MNITIPNSPHKACASVDGMHSRRSVLVSRLLIDVMVRVLAAVFAALAAVTCCFAQAAATPLSTAHDGLWSVSLNCADIRDQTGFVKGYTYHFTIQIVSGQLDGEGKSAPPAFIRFTGHVLSDGTLVINANGISGNPEVTVGKVPRGTPYRYTMKGKLDANRGRAERVELRPCTADFVRQN
jgi:hypothetical protein